MSRNHWQSTAEVNVLDTVGDTDTLAVDDAVTDTVAVCDNVDDALYELVAVALAVTDTDGDTVPVSVAVTERVGDVDRVPAAVGVEDMDDGEVLLLPDGVNVPDDDVTAVAELVADAVEVNVGVKT